MADSTTTASSTPQQGSLRWLAGFFGLVTLMVLLQLALAWRLDVYGLWRDPRGRALTTSDHERKAKYLLNGRYVPENFDALVVGGSSSINWQLGELGSYHFYNESLEGGDGTEERLLAEHALEHGHFRAAIVGLNPHVTGGHGEEDGLDQVRRAETLGSLSAFDLEWRFLRFRLHPGDNRFYPDGGHDMPEAPPPSMDQTHEWPMHFEMDAEGTADYVALVQDLQRHGVRLVYVVYPIFGPYYRLYQPGMEKYVHTMQSMLPAAPLLDFNDPQYRAFTDDPTNFIDQVHLSAKGTRAFTPLLRAGLQSALPR